VHQLNDFAYLQNIVVTLLVNTLFYILLAKPTGSGAVAEVTRSGNVWLTFKSPRLPEGSAILIVVRDKRVVGKLKFGWGQSGDRHSSTILEGTPQKGDLVFGWQREVEFTDPRAVRKSNKPLQPTAVGPTASGS
jgi:hypothetical protein